MAYTSVLKRAVHTFEIISGILEYNIPLICAPELNERNYGDLQGMSKETAAVKYGPHQLALWRRSYEAQPPNGESLKQTRERVVPYYTACIQPGLKAGKTILIVAHGNSLRALMMHLEGISVTGIQSVEIQTCVPKTYDFSANLKLQGTT